MLLKLGELQPGINTSQRVQVAKVGTFNHESYGLFTISELDLVKMKYNFEANARRQTMDGGPVLPFDYFHEEEKKAAGWITKLFIEADLNGVNSLFAVVDWTPKGADKIRDKELKFVSPSIRRNYKDAETGQLYDIILKGATLTNTPFLRDMEAIYLLSEEKIKAFMSKTSGDGPEKTKSNQGVTMPIEEMMAALSAMSPEDKKRIFEALAKEMESAVMMENDAMKEEKTMLSEKLELSEKALSDLKAKMESSGDLADKLKLAEGKTKDLSEKVNSLTKKLAENDKKAEFDVMLSEGRVCEAQRAPFMESDVIEFAKKAQVVKLAESGSNGSDSISNAEEKVEKLAEEKMATDKNLDYGEAVSLVLSENPKLAKEIN